AGLRSGPKTGHWVLPGETAATGLGPLRAPAQDKPAHYKKRIHHTQPVHHKKHSHHKNACSPQPSRVGSFVEVNRLFAVSLYLNGEHNFFVVSRLVLRWAAKRP
ncbi:hypothetical protein ACQKMW_20450, partial [Pseudomonas sivasensis]|uniref:hypothetical protein n=1 Tax=Pseudomonas sivasensis TaxID=1880678 RepID=UPI003CFF94A4